MKRIAGFAILSCCAAFVFAAAPPDLLNYQGVLRNAADQPLDGAYNMVFRLFSAETGGDEILVDSHAGVMVTGGLFNVRLGGGSLSDGAGPGTFETLSAAFGAYSDIHLEVVVQGEALSPRTPVVSAGYALNAQRVKGVELVSDGDLVVYVNGLTGDDANSGLSADSAKATIMGAIRSLPTVLNGDVNVRIQPGTYNEEVLLSHRTRNGPYWVRLVQDTSSPISDPPSVVITHPTPVIGRGITVTDELVEIHGIEVSGFSGEDRIGIVAAGGVELYIVNCILQNNWAGAVAVAGHFVRMSGGSQVLNNTLGVGAFEHGTFDVDAPVSFCGNGEAGQADDNSLMRINGSLTDCQLCVGDTGMSARMLSSVSLYGECANFTCTEASGGVCR